MAPDDDDTADPTEPTHDADVAPTESDSHCHVHLASHLVVPDAYLPDTPDDTNLALRVTLPFPIDRVVSLILGSKDLSEGEDYFVYGHDLFFRTLEAPDDGIDGTLVVKAPDDQTYDFSLELAQSLCDKMDSLAAQMRNVQSMADAAAATATDRGQSDDDVTAVRDLLLDDGFHKALAVLSTIEQSLKSDDDFATFGNRVAELPDLTAPEEEDT